MAAQQVAVPWRWLSKAQFEQLAGQAYLVATAEVVRACREDDWLDQDALDGLFSECLEDALQALLMNAARVAGNVDPERVARPYAPDGVAMVLRQLAELQAEGWDPRQDLTAVQLDAASEDLQ